MYRDNTIRFCFLTLQENLMQSKNENNRSTHFKRYSAAMFTL